MRLLSHKVSGRISSKRRSRLAAPLVLVIGLLVTGGLFAAFSPANANSKTDDATSIAKGRMLFQVGCASCHGQNAEGIVTERGNNYGPTLVGVGAAAVDFQVGTGRMPLAQPGSQAKQKEPVYTATEIEALGAYVQSLGPGPAVPESSQYSASGLTDKEMAQGGEFFRTNCTACHNFAGAGGALPEGKQAPSLNGVSEKHMFEAMITGPQQMPKFSNQVLTPKDKREIIGFLKKNEKTPAYGGFTLGSLGPVSEGMFAWLVGIGGLVGAAVWIAASTSRTTKKKVDA